MKRIFAGIAAVVLAMGMMTACGSVEKNSSEVSSSAAQAGEDGVADEETSEQTEDDPAPEEEQAAEETDEESEAETAESDNESASADYEVEYLDDSAELDKSALDGYVDSALQLARAIQQNDKEAAKKLMNFELVWELENINDDELDDELIDEALEYFFEYTDIKEYDFTADRENIKKVFVNVDYQSVELMIFFNYTDEEYIGIGVDIFVTADGDIVNIVDTIIETEPDNYAKKYRLKTANGNAKTGYNAIAEALADLETMGIDYDGVFSKIADIDCSKAPTHEVEYSATEEYLIYYLQKNFSMYSGDGGYVYLIFDEGSSSYYPVFYVQWRESMDSDIIGQYPEAPITVDAPIQWGEIYHYD